MGQGSRAKSQNDVVSCDLAGFEVAAANIDVGMESGFQRCSLSVLVVFLNCEF